jgi:hypothetical protein
MVSILSAKTKLQISKTKDPIAREYTLILLVSDYITLGYIPTHIAILHNTQDKINEKNHPDAYLLGEGAT